MDNSSRSGSSSSSSSWSLGTAARSMRNYLGWGSPPIQPQDTAASPADGSRRNEEAGDATVQVSVGLPTTVGQALALTIQVQPYRAATPPPQEIEPNDFVPGPAAPVTPVNADAQAPSHVTVHFSPGRGSAAARETLQPVHWHLPTDAASQQARIRVAADADRLGQNTGTRPLTSEETAHNADRWGRRMAVRDLVSQAVGRLTGLMVAADLYVRGGDSTDEQDDSGAQARIIMYGSIAILVSGLVFGLRAGYLMSRAWREEGEHPGTAALLGMGPTLAQLTMVMMALQYGGYPTGMAVTINIVNRLLSATVRDTVAQAQIRWWGGLDPVQSDGRDLDPTRSRAPFDRDRLQGARNTYLLSSLMLLWLGRWMMESILEEWIAQASPASWEGRMRAGLPSVIMSVINETFDAYQGSQWQDYAAQKHGLALKYVPGSSCAAGQCRQSLTGEQLLDFAREVGERSVSHAGMRQAFGTLTSDIWTTWGEFHPNSRLMEHVLRAVAAIFNSLTTYRGYTVERGRALRPHELREEIARQQLGLRKRIRDINEGRARPRSRLVRAMRTRLTQLFRQHLVDQGVQPGQMAQLDAELKRPHVRQWLDKLAADAARLRTVADLTARIERPFRLQTTGDNEFDLVPHNSASGSPAPDQPDQTPPPSLPGSAVPSSANTPAVPVRSLRREDRGSAPAARQQLFAGGIILQTMAGSTPPGIVDTLRPDDAIWANEVPATFVGWHNEVDERKADEIRNGRGLMLVASDEPVAAPGWPAGEIRGQRHIYRIDPAQFNISQRLAPVRLADDGMGLGPRRS